MLVLAGWANGEGRERGRQSWARRLWLALDWNEGEGGGKEAEGWSAAGNTAVRARVCRGEEPARGGRSLWTE